MRKRYILISIIRKIKTLKSEMEQDRGGVKLEFVRFDSKICDLIDSKRQKIFKNSIRINSKFIRFDSNYRVESNFSDAGLVRNSFDSIRKFMIRLIRKVKNNSKNLIKINLKFVQCDSTPPLAW